ncbi:hypothetical protein BCR34DRAFT_583887 [Clohesyomyces aquaticus]|uniref:Uncharacterized protein n=1 Tax=Clohesyomyces aquaticus TaxID=1231657 RepID=A0A1Y2A3M4_9PLEO|nr:hypothetical protein BCR34DRAFT_583887 [Clohesyomyces aquaticus]
MASIYAGVNCAEAPLGLHALLQMSDPGFKSNCLRREKRYRARLSQVAQGCVLSRCAGGNCQRQSDCIGTSNLVSPPALRPTYPADVTISEFPSWVPRLDWYWDPGQGSPSSIYPANETGASGVVVVGASLTPAGITKKEYLATTVKMSWELVAQLKPPTASDDDMNRFLKTLCAGSEKSQPITEESPSLRASFDKFLLTYGTLESGMNEAMNAMKTKTQTCVFGSCPLSLVRLVLTNAHLQLPMAPLVWVHPGSVRVTQLPSYSVRPSHTYSERKLQYGSWWEMRLTNVANE